MPSSTIKCKPDNKEEKYENPIIKSREKCLILSTFPVNLSLTTRFEGPEQLPKLTKKATGSTG